jgi:hypothetical protein
MRRQLRVVTTADAAIPEPPDLRTVVSSAIDTMDWLGPSDDALKGVALWQAQVIATAMDRAQELSDLYEEAAGDSLMFKRLQRLEAHCEVVRVVGLVGPQLTATLRDLGGSPGTRAAVKEALKQDKPARGRLAQLRGDADRRKS